MKFIPGNNKAKGKWKEAFSFNTSLPLCPVEKSMAENEKGHAMHQALYHLSMHMPGKVSPGPCFLRKWVAYADDTVAGQSPGLGNWKKRKGRELGNL